MAFLIPLFLIRSPADKIWNYLDNPFMQNFCERQGDLNSYD